MKILEAKEIPRQVFPAGLSFFLPGLGQLFCGKILKALSFFGVFSVGLFVLEARWLIVGAVLLSCADAYLWCPSLSETRDRKKEIAYAVAALIGILAWTNLFFTLS